jgi:hypothetical protein
MLGNYPKESVQHKYVLLIPKAWPLYGTESLHLMAYCVKGTTQRHKRNAVYVSHTGHRRVRFDVLMAVYMQTVTCWDITLHSGRQGPHIWKKHTASNFRVIGDEDGRSGFLQNVDIYQPNIKIPDTVSMLCCSGTHLGDICSAVTAGDVPLSCSDFL